MSKIYTNYSDETLSEIQPGDMVSNFICLGKLPVARRKKDGCKNYQITWLTSDLNIVTISYVVGI